MNGPNGRVNSFRRTSIGARRTSVSNLSKPAPKFTKHYENVEPLSYYTFNSDDYLGKSLDVKEAQDAAVARLTILEIIDDLCPSKLPDMATALGLAQNGLGAHLVEHGLSLDRGTNADLLRVVERDRVGHLVLRMALGVHRLDVRQWLVTQERRLFMYRLYAMKNKLSQQVTGKEDAMNVIWNILESGHHDSLPFEWLTLEHLESEDIVSTLLQQTAAFKTTKQFCSEFWSLREDQLDKSMFMKGVFKVTAFRPEVSFFIRGRQCYLSRGHAYINRLTVPILLLDRFTHQLNQSLDSVQHSTEGKKAIAVAFKHPQFGAFLKELPNAMSCNQNQDVSVVGATSAPSTVTAAMIPELIPRMPFCARRMIDTLQKQKHIRHWARLQLALFLKDVKMPVDEQIKFWGARWDDPQKFEREHIYTIRYQYGLEGKRQERGMYSCRTMLSSAFPVAGTTDAHGCPYRELKEPGLRGMLSSYGIQKSTDVEDICNLVRNGEFQRACQQSFTALHPGHDGSGVGNHPIQYYQESCNYCAKSASSS